MGGRGYHRWIAGLALALPFCAGAATPAEIAALVERAPMLQAYDARLEVERSRLEYARVGTGPAMYGSLGYRSGEEVVDEDRTRNLEQIESEIGIRVPVLGSRLQARAGSDEQRISFERAVLERELLRRELLAKAGDAIAEFWGARRVSLLAAEYLQHREHLEQTLVKRTAAGLVLDADRLEFASGFESVRRDELDARARQAHASGQLGALLGEDVDLSSVGAPPRVTACPVAPEPRVAISDDPELAFLEQVVSLRASSPRESALFPVSSDVRVAWRSTREATIQPAGSGVVMWTFDVPVGYAQQRRLQTSSAAAALSQARLERELRARELEEEVRFRLSRRMVLEQSLQLATVRLAASDESLREHSLRAAALPEDTIEQLLVARLARYQAARSVVDAEVELAHWDAQWSRFGSPPCGQPQLLAPARQGRSVYLWNSLPVIDAALARDGAQELDTLRSQHIGRLLLSLNAAQIADYRANPAPLARFLDAAHAAGLEVALLLGEPSWMLPKHRDSLIDIVAALQQLPFDGLHLDLEPSQIPESFSDETWILEQLAATVEAVRASVRWPIEISAHPRDLDRSTASGTLGERLDRLDVDVTLMIYVANPERAIAIATPILERYPGLRFRIALSLEEALSPEETLARYEPQERDRRITRVESGLAAANFGGVTLQPEPGWPYTNGASAGD